MSEPKSVQSVGRRGVRLLVVAAGAALVVAVAARIPAGATRDEAPGPDVVARRPANAGRQVVLTFDDLPYVPSDFPAGCEPAAVLALNRRLLDGLAAHGIPAVGLVNSGKDCGGGSDRLLRRVLTDWLDAGQALGNHTHSHRDLNQVSLDWYLGDVARGGLVADSLLRERGRRLRWFRAPMLHMGDTEAKRRGLEAFLSERGYELAPVTIDNQEWVYAAVYARARARGDDALAERVAVGYLEHVEASFAFYERLSRDVFGREIPQVLLLHINRMNADRLDALVERIEARGYTFVALDEALRDSAYDSEDGYVGPRGLSWIQRWAHARGVEVPPEPREAEWVAELFREG